MLTTILLLLSFIIIRTPDDGPMVPPTAIVRPVHSPTEGAKSKVIP